ncbi:hypothetical protein F4781DRAFT_441138 [Annulohypoxylon bovei var. microspora]|nr:hypothetical protein F4781DRAFT_441138 [Annulohypoxylon bovei var. microspora]
MADSISPPVNPNDPGIGPLIMGLTWTFTIISLIFIGLRFWVRITVSKLLNLEDWLMLAAGIINLIGQAFLSLSYHYGLGKHDRDLTFDQSVNVLKWQWLSSTPGIVSSAVARISIAILLARIFGTKRWLKWYLTVTTVSQATGSALLIIFSYAQSSPVAGVWNPTIPSRQLNPNYVVYTAYVLGSLWALGDLTYVLFPVIIVWKLNMQFRRKFLLCVLLAMSLITLGVSIVKTIHAQGRLGDKDEALFSASLGTLLGSLEQEFVIIMGCAPPLSSITKLKITSMSSITSSLEKLMLMGSSNRTHKTDNSTGFGEYSSNGTYYELGVAGQTLAGAHAKTETSSLNKTNSHNMNTSKISRTYQYGVTFDQEEETRRPDLAEGNTI